jgi:4-hydroxybenzoate polyprenyltransferase
VAAGAVLAPVLLAAGFALGALISSEFLMILLAYCTFTFIYSFTLKGVVLLDVLSLAMLYTLRILAGGAAVDVRLSSWLLLFSVFIFLSLAFVKRFAELSALDRRGRLRAAGRDYSVSDLPMLQSLGSTAGYLSIVVLALYINSPEVNILYGSPSVMWLLCVLLLYWISRVWIRAQRGEMDEDPVIFALKDRASRIVLLLSAAVILAAV